MATIQEALQQGWQQQRVGQFAVAEQIYRRVLDAKPDHAETLYLLGTVCQRQGKLDDAAQNLLMAVSFKPDYAEAHNNLGVVMAVMGRRIDAINHFRHVARLRPNDADAANNLGNALRDQGEFDEAIERLHHALRLRPDFPDALHNLGLALHAKDKPEDAVAHLQQAVRLRPDFADAQSDLGLVVAKLKRWEEAAACFEQLVLMRPGQADGHMHLGAVLREMGKLDESADRLHQAARLKPKDANIRSSLGLTLQVLGRLQESEEQLKIAIQIDPKHVDARNNLGVTLAQMCRFRDAIEQYDQAIRLDSDRPIFRRNRALAWLTLGEFERGWPDYDYRWKCPGFIERNYAAPRWQGEPIEGKTILLYAEQGLGDTLQFIRFAALVRHLGATVVAEVQPALARLMDKVDGIDEVVPMGEPLPRFDVHCPLLSLPGVLQTTVNSIPNATPYLFAETERDSFWRGQLASFSDFKIGICWQGNPKQGSDRMRSIPLAQFESLARMEGVQLLSLQKEPGSQQLREAGNDLPIIDLARRLDLSGGAFLDTAAVMNHLDLVITCDTSIAHLAGGLGVPVWVALCAAADWRWLDKREDTPWYSSMRLFRQTKLGRWDDVFERIADEVRKKLSTSANPQAIPIEISPGELLDKIAILQIKRERVIDPAKQQNIRAELAALNSACDRAIPPSDQLSALMRQLKDVNEAIWDVEGSLRMCERDERFDQRFVQLARSVYQNNDRRAAIKRQINDLFSSHFVEVKEHPEY
jgi:tetratricopeptide (TPR) repeat protein